MLTRAQSLMIIVGDPHTLQQDANWRQVLRGFQAAGVCTGAPIEPKPTESTAKNHQPKKTTTDVDDDAKTPSSLSTKAKELDVGSFYDPHTRMWRPAASAVPILARPRSTAPSPIHHHISPPLPTQLIRPAVTAQRLPVVATPVATTITGRPSNPSCRPATPPQTRRTNPPEPLYAINNNVPPTTTVTRRPNAASAHQMAPPPPQHRPSRRPEVVRQRESRGCCQIL